MNASQLVRIHTCIGPMREAVVLHDPYSGVFEVRVMQGGYVLCTHRFERDGKQQALSMAAREASYEYPVVNGSKSLLAAAPDMLDALRQVLTACESGSRSIPLDQIRAAIAKATQQP